MATTRFPLPKKPRDIARMLDQHVTREENRLSFRRLVWLLAWYYINGSRRFDVFDPMTGALQAHYLDSEGNMEFQLQEMMNIVDRTVGRLKEISPWPRVERTDNSLNGMRERAMMQLIMDSSIHPQGLEEAYGKFLHLFCFLGSCGVTGHVEKIPRSGLTTDFEIIHPKELFPFPSLGSDYTKQCGMVRQRVLPLSFLKELFGRRIMDHIKELETFEVPIGSQASVDDDEHHEGSGGRLRQNFREGGAESSGKEAQMTVVRLREAWIEGSGSRCVRYITASGDYVIDDQDLEDSEVYCPVGFHRFIDTGTFHGAGLFDKLFSTVRHFEQLVKDVINNVREIDRYGVLVLPHGGFQHNTIFKEIGDTLKVAYYEPDAAGQDVRPFMVAPYNAGDAPGKIATLTKAILDELSPIRDLAEEKGRVDSAVGLQVLEREIQRPITNATDGIRTAWGRMYRGLASNLLDAVSVDPPSLPVGRLTLDLAGVVFDAATSFAQFSENPIPTLSRLQFTTEGRVQASDAAKIQGAFAVAKDKMTDPMSLRLYFLKEGLDPPMYLEEEKAAYESVVENILQLFQDGQRPGQLILAPHLVRPELQLRVLSAFMQSPVMKRAQVEVVNAFMDYREMLLMQLQPILPPGVPEGPDLGMVRDKLGAGEQQPPGQPQRQQGLLNNA